MSEPTSQNHSSLPEKLTGFFGLLLVLMVAGYLIYQGINSNGPPDLQIEVIRTNNQGQQWLVEIEVNNQGGQTAQEAHIEGRLLPKGEPNGDAIETSEVTFGYAPPDSARKGGLIFHHNPNDYQLELRAKSYLNP